MKVRLGSLASMSILGLMLTATSNAEVAKQQEIAFTPIGKPASIPGVLVVKAADVLRLADSDEEMVIFDARSETARKQGKITWSESFEPGQLTEQRLADSVSSKNTVVLFYGDKDGQKAAMGAKIAAAKGYASVYWLQGGWSEWKQSGLRLDM